ncbi:MAG: hypothetical protein UR26_C0003G0097 [candidate division TM6 bacterium GW2011_GWF2_32_72]|nr:MAG: hypothetical protein UR26_C0003G0097 [candidate division TM6 bacterium GW2011_GWF2_32_72]
MNFNKIKFITITFITINTQLILASNESDLSENLTEYAQKAQQTDNNVNFFTNAINVMATNYNDFEVVSAKLFNEISLETKKDLIGKIKSLSDAHAAYIPKKNMNLGDTDIQKIFQDALQLFNSSTDVYKYFTSAVKPTRILFNDKNHIYALIEKIGIKITKEQLNGIILNIETKNLSIKQDKKSLIINAIKLFYIRESIITLDEAKKAGKSYFKSSYQTQYDLKELNLNEWIKELMQGCNIDVKLFNKLQEQGQGLEQPFNDNDIESILAWMSSEYFTITNINFKKRNLEIQITNMDANIKKAMTVLNKKQQELNEKQTQFKDANTNAQGIHNKLLNLVNESAAKSKQSTTAARKNELKNAIKTFQNQAKEIKEPTILTNAINKLNGRLNTIDLKAELSTENTDTNVPNIFKQINNLATEFSVERISSDLQKSLKPDITNLEKEVSNQKETIQKQQSALNDLNTKLQETTNFKANDINTTFINTIKSTSEFSSQTIKQLLMIFIYRYTSSREDDWTIDELDHFIKEAGLKNIIDTNIMQNTEMLFNAYEFAQIMYRLHIKNEVEKNNQQYQSQTFLSKKELLNQLNDTQATPKVENLELITQTQQTNASESLSLVAKEISDPKVQKITTTFNANSIKSRVKPTVKLATNQRNRWQRKIKQI